MNWVGEGGSIQPGTGWRKKAALGLPSWLLVQNLLLRVFPGEMMISRYLFHGLNARETRVPAPGWQSAGERDGVAECGPALGAGLSPSTCQPLASSWNLPPTPSKAAAPLCQVPCLLLAPVVVTHDVYVPFRAQCPLELLWKVRLRGTPRKPLRLCPPWLLRYAPCSSCRTGLCDEVCTPRLGTLCFALSAVAEIFIVIK